MAENLQKQRREAEIKQQNAQTDEALARTLAMINQTEDLGVDTLNTLEAQGKQLERVDKNLHEAKQDLKKSKYVLKGMKSWTASVNQYLFSKPPQKEEYKPVEDDRVYQTTRQQRRQKTPQDESKVIVLEGWLAKKGAGAFSGWKKRYCELRLNGDFAYFEEADKFSCKGTANFPDTVPIHLIKEEPEQFQVTDKTGREWSFQADSVEERETWCAALKQPDAYIEAKALTANPPSHVEYDQQLDNILNGVKRLGGIAADQRTELNYHDALLENIGDEIDAVDRKAKAQNKEIGKIMGR